MSDANEQIKADAIEAIDLLDEDLDQAATGLAHNGTAAGAAVAAACVVIALARGVSRIARTVITNEPD